VEVDVEVLWSLGVDEDEYAYAYVYALLVVEDVVVYAAALLGGEKWRIDLCHC